MCLVDWKWIGKENSKSGILFFSFNKKKNESNFFIINYFLN